ncbi:unnamed protein product [Rotaria magnacalcarata]|uniref:Uncharacterized protein n=1 Tax=Rotaria magnacalcarata TaxID=392030 RepID=A0A815YCL3_9BILA|nr:unnamed protein product [Rotaria magnacalcarata]CAF1568087.1 unnamed protein product [Rotaria magnacalcarata]CAF1922879.1 unnamed protein product [Rotaria magnacalcarata]CAF4403450.1 unnamed protein product [Rotaria magnacalcarata]CAF4986531.1 unnamed protein product [Rotaria magnacalcarata]
MTTRRYLHTVTLWTNGKVSVAGGNEYNCWGLLNSAEIYDPSTGVWTRMSNMSLAYYQHTVTLLTNGQVLVVGRYISDGYSFSGHSTSSELYNPLAGIWTKGDNMTVSRIAHTTSVLSNGKVLVIGGTGYNGTFSSAELYS